MRRRLLFVSPRFLFPLDSGGRIRTAQILRGMKGGSFSVTLALPHPPAGTRRFERELDSVCDRLVTWPEEPRGALFALTRLRHGFSRLPISVATDRSAAGRRVIDAELERNPDVVVFDFAHSGVLCPRRLSVPSVLFTHNVESWIFRRHAEVASNPLLRAAWRNQWRKMSRFERETVARFDTVVAVSEEDGRWFRDQWNIERAKVIPTGVDLDYFEYVPPADSAKVIFTGSMDWMANQDGIVHLMDDVWPGIAASRSDARMVVIGRDPPRSLVRRADGNSWTFTGFVDDVRPWVRGGSVYVIPLRVGGGTRLKVFEAMAMGCPVVSTSIGVEGLPLEPGTHYLRADTAEEFAAAVLRLLGDRELRQRLSLSARKHVEQNFSAGRAAEVFERICLDTAGTTFS